MRLSHTRTYAKRSPRKRLQASRSPHRHCTPVYHCMLQDLRFNYNKSNYKSDKDYHPINIYFKAQYKF